MDNLTRLLVLVVAAGLGVTLLAGVARWYADEGRRVRRGLKAVLKGEAHGFLVARGRGRGVGFNFTANKVAVVWDQGAWGLLYGLDELIGAEVIVDFQVVGRVHRGEARRALDAFGAEERVALRLVFDDLSQPDFVLDLWLPQDAGRRDELPPDEAIAEANRWLARIEALLRRPVGPRRAAQVVATPAAVEVAPMGQPSSAASPAPLELQSAEDEDDEF
ncbi:MAG TPA: hypothetical protein VGH86_08660 [Phenylobacterium sp.]|jgi:hypothetical protein